MCSHKLLISPNAPGSHLGGVLVWRCQTQNSLLIIAVSITSHVNFPILIYLLYNLRILVKIYFVGLLL